MALTSTLQDKLGMAPHAVEAKLDQAVEDSFPASDPVQLSMPHDRKELDLHQRMTPATMMLVGGGLLALIALMALRR